MCEVLTKVRPETSIVLWACPSSLEPGQTKKGPQPFVDGCGPALKVPALLYCMLTSICLGLASSFLGRVNRNTPSLN